jgi:hypothetical protein
VTELPEYYRANVPGEITTDNDDGPMKCPKCGTTRGLTVCGYLGKPGRVECPRGHKFEIPEPQFDAVEVLQQVVADPRWTVYTLTYGPLPER